MRLFKVSYWFVQNEDGAVSADWVVLTAFCIGVAVTLNLGQSVTDYGVEIDGAMTQRGIPTYGTNGGNSGLN